MNRAKKLRTISIVLIAYAALFYTFTPSHYLLVASQENGSPTVHLLTSVLVWAMQAAAIASMACGAGLFGASFVQTSEREQSSSLRHAAPADQAAGVS